MSSRVVPFVLGLAASLVTAHSASAQKATRPPNIVQIVADDVAWDDLSCFGSKDLATPNLDRLAAQGMRFTSFYAPHSTCTPTRAALLTGCYAQRVGLPRVLFPTDRTGLAADERTIAEVLHDAGYATACIGKWHLGHRPEHLPTRHGFDLFFGIPYPNDHGPERLDKDGKTRGFPPIPLLRGEQVVEQPTNLAKLPERFVAEALAFVQANKARPFFLHFGNIETHTPWLVTRRFQGQSKAGVYGDAVQCLDRCVGELLDALDAAGIANDTLVVFQSDNGPLTSAYAELEGVYGHTATVDTTRQHALRGEKYSSRYEGGTRVACIARWPGRIAAGKVDEALAAGFDWYPTFAAAAGVAIPPEPRRDGVSLLDRLTGTGTADPNRTVVLLDGWRVVAARRGPWKLVLRPNAQQPPELFDLAADLGETTDVAAAHADVVRELLAAVEAARADLGDGKAGPGTRPAHVLEK
ncbi:MAG: sulfatase [Planctomycetes bacterium]|nr:sulfatase [Planctomycetota bacterium]